MQFRTVALKESIDLQKKIIEAEQALFDLNSYSTFLSVSLDINRALLVFSVLAPPEMAEIEKIIQELEEAQQTLDKTQKGIIKATNALIKVEKARILYKLNKDGYDQRQQWSYFLNALCYVTFEGDTVMAVEPDDPSEVAPNYGLTKNYKQQQMVAFKWHLLFSTKDEAQRFLDTTNNFELSVGATANKGETWSVEIKKDRY